VPVIGRQRQEHLKFETSLEYIMSYRPAWATKPDPVVSNKKDYKETYKTRMGRVQNLNILQL
jgi:hypothetical protein